MTTEPESLTPEARRRILTTFPGYGNPKTAWILFVGIEEGKEWSDKPKQVDTDLRDMERGIWLPGKASPTELMQVRLSTALQGMRLNKEQLTEYYKHDFCRKHEFAANLYPIACGTTSSWPEHYPSLFKVPENKCEFRRTCHDERLHIIRNLIKRVGAKEKSCIIFLGKALWQEIPAILPDSESMKPVPNRPRLMHDETARRWCAYHPSRGWFTQDDADYLVREFLKT